MQRRRRVGSYSLCGMEPPASVQGHRGAVSCGDPAHSATASAERVQVLRVPIKCHYANCINYYHATCAQDAGCILDAEAEGEGVVFTITCPSHTFASGKKSVPPKPMSQNSVIDISDSELSALAHELDEADWDDFATESQAVQRPSTGITSEAKRFCGEGHVPSPTSTSQLR